MAGSLIVAIALTMTAAIAALWWAIEHKPRKTKEGPK